MTKLTTASCIKITLIIALGLLILGSIGFGGCSVMRFGMLGGTEMGSANVDAASVKNLSVKWVSGAVSIDVVDEGNAIVHALEQTAEAHGRLVARIVAGPDAVERGECGHDVVLFPLAQHRTAQHVAVHEVHAAAFAARHVHRHARGRQRVDVGRARCARTSPACAPARL